MHLQSILKQAVDAGCACQCVYLRGPSFFNTPPPDEKNGLGYNFVMFYSDALRTADGWSLGTLAGVLNRYYWFSDEWTGGILQRRPFKTCAWDMTTFNLLGGPAHQVDPPTSADPASMLAAWTAVSDYVPLPPIGQYHDLAIYVTLYVDEGKNYTNSPHYWRYTPHVTFRGCMASVLYQDPADGDYYYGGGVIVPLDQDEEFNLP